jgi:glycosyltransferase involved in cell wall biosynthesis
MKIAVVVHGRFHAFDLGSALLRRGHDVTLFTNYPKWAVKRFGFPEARVRSFWVHGVVSRGAFQLYNRLRIRPEWWLNPLFGKWAARELSKESWDVIHPWSGVAEEISVSRGIRTGLNLIMRGSAHIRTQHAILQEEEERTSATLDKPDKWICRREEREYKIADRIVVLSTFAQNTFVARGVDPRKLCLLPLGANTATFRPTADVIEARCRRILSGTPLRVLYVGALSLQKGLWDARAIARGLTGNGFHFRFVGPVTREARAVAADLRLVSDVVGKIPQRELPRWYAEGDIFLFPTLQDGFAVVLAQAQASGLPILTTPNCTGPDLVREGESGWILPPRNPAAFVERLRWCEKNRAALAGMVRHLYTSHQVRTWDHVGEDFETLCLQELQQRQSS